MTIEIRATSPDEHRLAANTMAAALLFAGPTDEEWAEREQSWKGAASVSAWDDGRCVGHAGAFRFDTTVPGGARLPTFGVTRVGVLPTHTRHGLLTTMMTDLLTQAHEEGAVLASLRASEAVIYQRFGFGIAGEAVVATLTAATARPVASPAAGSMRLLARDEIVEAVAAVYDRCRGSRIGTISRPHTMVRRYFADAITGTKPSFVAVHHAVDGTPDGYVHYDVSWHEHDSDETGAGEVHEVWAAAAATERALFAYVLGIDLVRAWKLAERPVDDPLRFAIRDTRAYRIDQRFDEQWLRLLDVGAALNSRTYTATTAAAVTVAVTDALFPSNTGTWRIDAAGAVSTDVAADDADLSVDIATLSAAYLGGTTWQELADAGRVTAARPGAVGDADVLFLQRPAPFCGSFF